jgi:hypothetical protein
MARGLRGKVFGTCSIHRKGKKKMHSTSKSLKVTAGALAIALAILGLTACGGGGKLRRELSPMPGTSISHSEVGSTLQ